MDGVFAAPITGTAGPASNFPFTEALLPVH